MKFVQSVIWGTLVGFFAATPLAAANVTIDDRGLLAAIQADKAQAAGLTGKGVKVAVISAGLYDLSAVQADGNLPQVTIVGGSAGQASSEGVAMLELVHQIAPDAELYYCDSQPMPLCVKTMVQTYGVNIVVDDVGQDAVIFAPSSFSFMYDQLLATYPQLILIHAAGNFYQYNNYNAWNPTNVSIGGTAYAVQDFGKAAGGASQPYQTFILGNGESLRVGIEWTDDPTLPPPTTNNVMGIWVMDTNNQILASDTGSLPTGFVLTNYTNNTGGAETVRVAGGVVTQNNADPLAVLVWSDSPMPIPSPGGAGGQYGASQETLSIGASDLGSGTIATFSDQGPFLQFWSATQSGIAPNGVVTLSYTRLPTVIKNQKPDLTGIDCDGIDAPTGFKAITGDFCGTSAAAPTVAGVFALVMQASGNALSRAALVQDVEKTASHVVSGVAQGTWDGVDGYGVVQAWDAAKTYIPAASFPTCTITSPTNSQVVVDTSTPVTFAGNCSVASGQIVSYTWQFGDNTSATSVSTSMSTSAFTSSVSHTYTTPGSYLVTFNGTSSAGYNSLTPAEMSVTVYAPTPPAGKSGGGGSLGLLALCALGAAFAAKRHRKTA